MRTHGPYDGQLARLECSSHRLTNKLSVLRSDRAS
jgi:hypothetical protein